MIGRSHQIITSGCLVSTVKEFGDGAIFPKLYGHQAKSAIWVDNHLFMCQIRANRQMVSFLLIFKNLILKKI